MRRKIMWEQILSTVEEVNNFLNGIVWGWPVVILILGTGILLTVRTKFLQVRKFGESLNTTIVPTLKSLGKKREKDSRVKSVSQFEAFSTAISGTVGTGNIVGAKLVNDEREILLITNEGVMIRKGKKGFCRIVIR